MDTAPVLAALPAFGCTRVGAGKPLLLIHGLGSLRQAWDPVIEDLAGNFDVIAIDLPGFGETPPLPPGVEPTPAVLAQAVAEELRRLNVSSPHIAGNSLGGWVALELAAQVPVASLTLLSPAGLWKRRVPRYSLWSLKMSRSLARHFRPMLRQLVGTRVGRAIVLGQVVGRPTKLTGDDARAAIEGLGSCAGFDSTLKATKFRRFASPLPGGLPITLMFGSRDHVLRKRQGRHTDALPADIEQVSLKGVGHVPMADDPTAVAELIRRTAGHPRSGVSLISSVPRP